MKLLVVSHSCVTPVNQQFYAEVQRRSGWEITIVVPSNWRDEFGRTLPVERLPAFYGDVIGVPVFLSGKIILHAYRTSFTRLIRRLEPDAIYVNHEPYALATAQVYRANRRAGHRPIGFYSCQNISKRYPIPFRWNESNVYTRSRFAFPISPAVEQVIRGKGYAGESTVLPLAIDTRLYRAYPDEAAAIRRQLTPAGEPLIGFVGRFVQEKGLQTLIAAMTQLRGLPWRLAMIGAGPLESELRSAIAAAGLNDRVTFVGFVPHARTPAYLSAFDVLVLPSETQPNWKEQFGRVLLEAMACGTAVLGSDSGEIPTLITDTNGGLTFRERDAGDLASKLTQLITDASLREQLAQSGSAAVASRYSTVQLAERFVATVSRAASPASET